MAPYTRAKRLQPTIRPSLSRTVSAVSTRSSVERPSALAALAVIADTISTVPASGSGRSTVGPKTHLDQLDSIDVTERYCHLACASDTFRFERALDISILSADVHSVGRQINYIHMDSSPGFCPSKIKFCSGPSRNNPNQSSLFAKWGSYARKLPA